MKRSSLMTLSVVAHVAVAVGLGAIQVQKAHTPTAVELIDVPKPKPEPPKPPTEPPKPKSSSAPKPSRPRLAARAATAAPAASPHTSSFDGLPDFGVALSGTGDGLAIAIAQPAPEPVSPQAKTLTVPPRVTKPPACSAKDQKPTPISVPRPEYPTNVRDFEGEGRVRIRLTVDERGDVIAAEVLSGMRDEFNQAALTAARRARFEPGLRCGNPVTASFTIAMRFSSS